MQTHTVVNTTPRGHKKQVSVLDANKRQLHFMVPRFACIGKQDQLAIDPEHPQSVFVVSREKASDLIRVAPQFEASTSLPLGNSRIEIRLTEVNRPEDAEALSYLEQFHYRTATTDTDDEADLFGGRPKSVSTTGGRRAVIILYVRVERDWTPAAYIELQMPLMMAKPRHDLFSNIFTHPTRPIHWSVWDPHAMRKYLNLIVRIARVVVSPEFRGLGLARILIGTAKDFCKQRWHISGARPIFLEISAEMLNYIDFVSSSGFRFVDKTEGNASRVVKDLGYMAKGYEVTSGIMSLQKKYTVAMQAYADALKRPLPQVLKRLGEIVKSPDPTAVLTPAEWAAFRSVIRLPRPYYLLGLDDYSSEYLKRHLSGRTAPVRKQDFRVKPVQLKLSSISIRSTIELKQTRNVRIILDSFGLKGDRLTTQLVPRTPIAATGGNILMIVGASGAGKSVLLRALDPSFGASDPSFEIRVTGNRDYSAGWLRQLPLDIPIFDYFAERYTAERAFAALSQAGLSDAFALVKPFALLSRGQQYRAMVADLLLRDDQVWLIDEFCADLDPLTAKIVAHNIRRHVISSGRVAVVAAANHDHYLDALRPTRVLRLKAGVEPQMLTYKEYRDGLLKQAG